MTDTGQIPGEGLPENAGMVEQPGIPAPDAYTFLDPSEHTPEDDDLLLMPTSQGAWSDPQTAPAPAQGQPAAQTAVAQPAAPEHGAPQPQQQVPAQQGQAAPAPAETHSTHESGGRDTGSVDLNGVRIPAPAPAPVGAHAAAAPARRPLHRGPASAEAPTYGGTQGGVVRSLADRGPAGATRTAAPARHAGPPTTGPEYFEAPAEDPSTLPGPQLGEIPPQAGAPWGAQPPQPEPVVEAVAEQAPAETAPQPEQVVEAEQPVAEAPVAEQPVAEQVVAEAPVAEQTEVETAEPVQTVPPVQAVQPAEPVAVPAPAAVSAAPIEQPEQPVQPAAGAQPEPAPQPEPTPQAVPAETVVPEPVAVEAPPAGPVAVPESGAAQPEASAEAPAQAPADEVAAPGTPEPVEAQHGAAVAPEPEAQAVPVETAAPEPQAPAQAAPAVEPVAQPEQELVEPAPEPVPAAPVAESPEAVVAPEPVVAPETAVAEPVAEPLAPEPVQPEPVAAELVEHVEPAAPVESAEPVTQGAEGAQAQEPTAQQLPVTEQEATPVPAPAPEPAVEPGGATEAEAADVLAPDAEDGTGPEVIETPELPAPDQQAPAEAPQQSQAPQQPEAAEQPAEQTEPFTPPAPGYDDAEREAVLRVMRERRDIRNGFRSDPIPHEVLLRVLEAAHTAPSVGHSQPWDFVVIRSAETRRSMHELAQSQRDAYAKSLPKGRAKQFKELKIEAILDTPVNIVVTADPTRGGRHTLGRHTQPQMAPYSSALAVENLWLAARAEGLGVGWVSFFDEREMVRALGLPEHLEVVAYLCVGYVDEFPEEPELMQAGWSKRRPLSWVVHEETYGRRALPGAEPHDLLQETISAIRPLDAKALGEAWERQKRMTKPAGALGMLEIISAQLSGLSRMCPPPIPEPAAVAIFAGDHGVHAQGVTAWPQEVTAQMVANFLGGGAVCNAFAAQVGAEVCVVDVGVATDLPATPGLLPRKVRPGTADFTTGPALAREEVLAAIEVGIETARDLVAAGNKALLTGEMGIANTTASAALICVYTGIDASEVTGRGTGINDEMHARKVDVVRRALDLHQPDPTDPIGVLAAVGGLEHAAMAGFLLGGASLRTPVILDGVSAGAAALVARAIAPEALAACIAGHRSAEPGHVAALNKLGLRPLVDLDLRLGEGTGALLALPIVQSAARAMHEVATFDSAGVTEK
ncbi:nicotinate-nucleotide--dimethylbenzimidazole phosphoribosyltransferase [Streptomyces anulatus]|uniref:nicotinate-nucleotide--dimethylbenzimidazole phosphoribosyltransferase n=1 Tax=Streptomyces anulatus TaxID=1892 RepID=UPI002DD8D355|nr:nicotinate-nucleotide--dimethylbenzimidazole phosphoribosyltransferase [Streptomyces anulatus]WSC60320.1 nicotinate-nucleotide--dimethylbenzimidazole phosphoribosyltransferase [Streptomyces anulatus]